jgi:hypothetical protein
MSEAKEEQRNPCEYEPGDHYEFTGWLVKGDPRKFGGPNCHEAKLGLSHKKVLVAAAQMLDHELQAAEQRAADIETRHKNMAAEFELIAAGKHPRYWTIEPGDVLFRRDGKERKPIRGEFFGVVGGDVIRASWDFDSREFPIYRRLESPANQIADAGKMVEPSPAPAEEPEPKRIVEHQGKRYRFIGTIRCQAYGEHFWHHPSNEVWRAEQDYSNNAYEILEEVSLEATRLNKLRVDEALAANEKHRETLQKLREANQRRIELEDTKSALLTQIEHLKDYQARVLDPMATPQPEAKGASDDDNVMTFFTDADIADIDAGFPSPSHSLPAGDGEAEPAESGKNYYGVAVASPGHNVITYGGRFMCEGHAQAAAAVLNNRDSLMETLESKLAKYKRDAEAWEAVRVGGYSVIRELGREKYFIQLCGISRDQYSHGESVSDPVDAVLSLAAQLEQK